MRYVGGVRIGSSTLATATIDDIDSPDWTASLREMVGFDEQSGPVTVYLLDGDRAGGFAVGNLQHRDGYEIVFGATRFGLGRTESGPDVDLGD